MRSSIRFTLLGFAFCICLAASSVLVTVFLVSPASAQTYIPHWDPETVQVLESEREVVLTLRKHGPGPVRYETEDGRCTRRIGGNPPSGSCIPGARAPGDYGAVSGDLVFTEAGTRTIRIAIVDDDVDEEYEAFSIFADEGDRRAGGLSGSIGTVWIIDDDSKETSGSSSSSGQSNPQPAGPQTDTRTRPAPSPATTSSSSEPTDAGNQVGSGVVNAGDPILEVEGSAGDEAISVVDKPLDANRGLSLLLIGGLGTLLIVTTASGFGLKRNLARRRANNERGGR